MPDLGGDAATAFYLFLCVQTQWERSAMSGQRLGIPRDRLKIEADARGIELTETILEKIAICETEVIVYDKERIEAEMKNR